MGLTTRLSALWGFLEATIFFIVPDVLLTYLATQKQRSLGPAIIAATLGALVGGGVMYLNGMTQYYASQELLLLIPAIDDTVIAKVTGLMAEHGYWGLFFGPILGLPYKIFAVQAAAMGVDPWLFFLLSIPARCLRFLLLCTLVRVLVNTFMKRLTQKQTTIIWLCSWTVFYLTYFAVFGW